MFKELLSILPLAVVLLGISTPVYAYLDPGTGSIILQGVIAAIATASFATKMYWQRIKAYFKGERNQIPDQAEDDKQGSPD